MPDMEGLHIRHISHIGHMYGPPTSLMNRHVLRIYEDSDIIWNPVHLDRIGQNATYWYVPVRTCTTRYNAVPEFHGSTYRYVPVHTCTYFQQDKLFSDSPRKSQER